MFALWSVMQDHSLRQAEVDLQVLSPEARSDVSRCCDNGVFSNLSFKMSELPEPRRKM